MHQDPKDAGVQASRINSKILGFQDSRAYRSRFFTVPWFQDLMTHEAAWHRKRRSMQTNKAVLKLGYIRKFCYGFLKGSCKTSCKAFLQGLQQRVSARFMPGFHQRVPSKVQAKIPASQFQQGTATSIKKETKPKENLEVVFI